LEDEEEEIRVLADGSQKREGERGEEIRVFEIVEISGNDIMLKR